jgi:hypothetical protein
MPEYYVTSNTFTPHSNLSVGGVARVKARVLIIKADWYEQANSGDYHFFEGDKVKRNLVASVPDRDVFSIVETKEAYQGDFITDLTDDENPDEDICLDCQYHDLLESEAFWDKVWDIVDSWHEPDEPETAEPRPELASGASPTTSIISEVEHWKDLNGTEIWGFHTPKGFVDVYTKQSAVECREQYIQGYRNWGYLTDMSGYTKVEETIQ